MEIDFEKIVRLKKLRVEKSELSAEETRLSRPLLKDRSLIKVIYNHFVDILENRSCPPLIKSVTQRKKFIFIILYLYAPDVLVGSKMPKGLREDISNALDIHAMSTISQNCSDVVFLYQNYADFSSDIESLYREIMQRISKNYPI